MSHISLPSVRIAPLGTGGAPADEVISSTRAGSFSSLTVTGASQFDAAVGIRNVNTAHSLTVRGSTGTKENAIRWERGEDGLVAGGLGYFYDSENSVAIGSLTNHSLKLYTNDITRLTITSEGRLLVGTTSAGDSQAGGIRATGVSQFDSAVLLSNRLMLRSGASAPAFDHYVARFTATHMNTGLHLHAANGGNPHAHLALWASEPARSWHGTGIGNNYGFRGETDSWGRYDTAQPATYIRFYENTILFHTLSAAGAEAQPMRILPNAVALGEGIPLLIGNTQVVTSRRTGWGAPTGTATRTAFATGSVTTAQLAESVKALIDDLTTHGLIGA
jgi:hypothetical protein